jgi:hypothetical protein
MRVPLANGSLTTIGQNTPGAAEYFPEDVFAGTRRAMTQPNLNIQLESYDPNIPKELQFWDGQPFTAQRYDPYSKVGWNKTPDDKTKDMQYDWEGNFRGSNHPDWWGKREFNPVKYNQMKDYVNRANYPRVAEDTSDLSGIAAVQTPLVNTVTHDDEDNPYDFTDRLRRRKDFTTKYPSYNPWQMRAAQAPGWKRNIGRMMDFLRGPGTRLTPAQQRANQNYMNQQRITRDPHTRRMQGGLFAGQNAPGTSFFGSKTFPEMAQKWALKNQHRTYKTPKMKQKQRDIINIATGGRREGTGTTITGHGKSGMGRDPSDRMARGGLASLWPR